MSTSIPSPLRSWTIQSASCGVCCHCLTFVPKDKGYLDKHYSVNKSRLFPTRPCQEKRGKYALGTVTTRMGLFGLGWPEIAVIVVVGTLIFGPKKISELGKDLGKVVGSMKQATNEFSEGMQESLRESEERHKKQTSSSEKEEHHNMASIPPSLNEQVYDVNWEKAGSEKETTTYR